MQFKKYQITGKSKKVDTQLVSFIGHGGKRTMLRAQTQNFVICRAFL